MNKEILRKYFIMGSQNCLADPVETLEKAIDGGITCFQYREKGDLALVGDAKVALGLQLRERCKSANIPFIINDDIDLIELLDVDGIHVGQSDMSVRKLRAKYPDLIIGLSISNLTELRQSPLEFVDYVGAGPVFETRSKADANPVAGLKWIESLRSMYSELPLVGIGGINPTNKDLVLKAGADGVSVISAISKASDIKEVVKQL